VLQARKVALHVHAPQRQGGRAARGGSSSADKALSLVRAQNKLSSVGRPRGVWLLGVGGHASPAGSCLRERNNSKHIHEWAGTGRGSNGRNCTHMGLWYKNYGRAPVSQAVHSAR
jgi:hypothetical protein